MCILDTMKLCIPFNELCTWHTNRHFWIRLCFQMHNTFLILIISHNLIHDLVEVIRLFLRAKQNKRNMRENKALFCSD